MARAPLLLQESLLFPYGDGLSFEQKILVKAGKELVKLIGDDYEMLSAILRRIQD